MSLLAVTAVLVACLCGCGKEKNSMDYKALKELLDKIAGIYTPNVLSTEAAGYGYYKK